MTGYIDQADKLAARQHQLAKTELRGHTASPLDLQTVGIFSGQRLDKG